MRNEWVGGLVGLVRRVYWAPLLLCLCVAGCGEKVEMKPYDNTGGVSTTDQEKIKKHLEDAGIKGELGPIVDDNKQWIVDVGAPKPPPGKRASPTMPVTYLIDKETGKVTSTENR
jgi:hypothetical protein